MPVSVLSGTGTSPMVRRVAVSDVSFSIGFLATTSWWRRWLFVCLFVCLIDWLTDWLIVFFVVCLLACLFVWLIDDDDHDDDRWWLMILYILWRLDFAKVVIFGCFQGFRPCEEPKVKVDQKDTEGMSALMYAAEMGHMQVPWITLGKKNGRFLRIGYPLVMSYKKLLKNGHRNSGFSH